MIYLLLGTDMGDREANLSRARELLGQRLGALAQETRDGGPGERCGESGKLSVQLRCSEVIETAAIGFDGPAFLNQAVAFDGDFEPYELLRCCQAIEVEMGRAPHKARFDEAGRRIYEPRIIDIDILHLNGVVMDEPELTIPHRQVFQRLFVLGLMQQAAAKR